MLVRYPSSLSRRADLREVQSCSRNHERVRHTRGRTCFDLRILGGQWDVPRLLVAQSQWKSLWFTQRQRTNVWIFMLETSLTIWMRRSPESESLHGQLRAYNVPQVPKHLNLRTWSCCLSPLQWDFDSLGSIWNIFISACRSNVYFYVIT